MDMFRVTYRQDGNLNNPPRTKEVEGKDYRSVRENWDVKYPNMKVSHVDKLTYND